MIITISQSCFCCTNMSLEVGYFVAHLGLSLLIAHGLEIPRGTSAEDWGFADAKTRPATRNNNIPGGMVYRRWTSS